MLALIENTVRVTIRHSDSEAIASEAATASASLDESASAGQRTKPAGPGDRVMVQFPHCASESPANTARCRSARGQHCGDAALKMAKSRRIRPYFRRSGLGADLGVLPPVHGDKARSLLDPVQPRSNRGECGEVVIAAIGDMGIAIKRDVRDS